MKIIFDILISIIALTILLPVIIFVAILIIIIDRNNPLFVQERVGKNKVSFNIIKFRTMKEGKIALFGKILRKTGIDEIPQFINILKFDMSLVGPRPLTIKDIVRLGWDSNYYERRWSYRPGIVGLAQLSPVCNKKMSWFFDKLYLSKQNFLLDLKIICASMAIPVFGKSKVKNWIHSKR